MNKAATGIIRSEARHPRRVARGLGVSLLLHAALLTLLLARLDTAQRHIALPGPPVPVLLMSIAAAAPAQPTQPAPTLPKPASRRISAPGMPHRQAQTASQRSTSTTPAASSSKPAHTSSVASTEEAAPEPAGQSRATAVDALPDTPPPLAYLIRLSRIVSRSQQYPWSARIDGQQGDALVRIHLHRDGRVLGVRLLQSSGVAALDEEACEVMRRIARFPPFPADYQPRVGEFDIDQPVSFLHYLSGA